MGGKESRPAIISYEEALKRVSEQEAKRIQEAFKRSAATADSRLVTAAAFTRDVLAGAVPPEQAQRLYQAVGGGRKGLSSRDLLCALVLLTKGTVPEKIKFLWTLYCNESGTHVQKWDFLKAIRTEAQSVRSDRRPYLSAESLGALFGRSERVDLDRFVEWMTVRKDATLLSRWLLLETPANLTSDLETPTFYQTLAGVTHLEERDILTLEKCFWNLRTHSATGQLDAETLSPLLSPPVPRGALRGLFLALDENHDGHVDFKELCCGLSAACRGPTCERIKFCFKVFDTDRDGFLNQSELRRMADVLCLVTNEAIRNADSSERSSNPKTPYVPEEVYESLRSRVCGETNESNDDSAVKPTIRIESDRSKELPQFREKESFEAEMERGSEKEWGLSQEEFLIWCIEKAEALVDPFLQLIYEVCHIVLGLRPQCKHQEQQIVLGWLRREVKRGYSVGQFWYLISTDWWNSWLSYTGDSGTCSVCGRRKSQPPPIAPPPIDEAIVCDETFNSLESMGDLLGRAETSSMGSGSSSSGVSSSSSSKGSRHPGSIDNTHLIVMNPFKVRTLTGEGGHLRRDMTLAENIDFELVPDSLWKALAQWYGGLQPLPRQVIHPPNSDIELELYPINLKLYQHAPPNNHHTGGSSSWSGMVGGYGAAALSTVGMASTYSSNIYALQRNFAYTAAFSRLATIKQVIEFICCQLDLAREDVRLWLMANIPNGAGTTGAGELLEEEGKTLAELGIKDGHRLLIEVRNKDLTWPEELGALSQTASVTESRASMIGQSQPNIPHPAGTTGLHNLGNTCFMNAALQAVWNTGPLTRYFTREMHLFELNIHNPHGTGGKLAQAYGELCKEVWGSGVRSVAPINVRVCVWKHASRFRGGDQHDSQELLAWLLDALHEDLNRVGSINTPYSELRDSDGRPDQVVAQEAWDQHTAKNQSIITELFYGQLKSKVTCTVCGHESVRFDPFNMLSLQLPMESFKLVEVLVIFLNGSVPVKYGMRLNSEARYSDIKQQLSKLCGVSANSLLIAEIDPRWPCSLRDERHRSIGSRIIRVATALHLFAFQLPVELDEDGSLISDSETVQELNGGVHNDGVAYKNSAPERLSSSGEGNDQTNTNKQLDFQKNSSSGYNTVQETNSDSHEEYATRSLTASPKKINRLKGFSPKCSPIMTPKIAKDLDYREEPNGNNKASSYLVAVHRKQTRQDVYFLSQHKHRWEVFGAPLILPARHETTGQELYAAAWRQVERLLSAPPPTPPDQANHATDCDDSLGYTFPFTLRAVDRQGQFCAVCPWTLMCRGCSLPCTDEPFLVSKKNETSIPYGIPSPSANNHSSTTDGSSAESPVYEEPLKQLDITHLGDNLIIAIDWDPTALHLRYQSNREKTFIEDESVPRCRREQNAPVELQHCLKAFTSEERLEQKYSCSSCKCQQPATKKLQIWRLPPVLIIHLKRFQYVNNKWIKSQKVVNFPYKDFYPTAFLASVPQETILRHYDLVEFRERKLMKSSQVLSEGEEDDDQYDNDVGTKSKTNHSDNNKMMTSQERTEVLEKIRKDKMRKGSLTVSTRERLESTSLLKTPVIDDDFVDYHQHKLMEGEDPFNLKYRLYAVVSHSGQMNGGHYVAYSHNPNGAWYCYNDSSCREIAPDGVDPSLDPSTAYMLFYERDNLDYETYLPDVSQRQPVTLQSDITDSDDNDLKKMCSIS